MQIYKGKTQYHQKKSTIYLRNLIHCIELDRVSSNYSHYDYLVQL